MNRNKKLALNSITSLLYQILSLICGFVLPRFFLTHYGSTVNGLVSSITQFLGFISLCECGVGTVVQSALYKPLADGDQEQISKIVISGERFFRKIALILAVYTAGLMLVYPVSMLESFDYLYTLTLIFVISISTFAQYFFGMSYRILLYADQLAFINLIIQSSALVLNAVCCIVLMSCGFSIQIVKLTSSLIFLMQPLAITYIAKRRFRVDRSIVLTEEPIKQKWNGLSQHIAAVILNNTDTIVLTVLSTLENVSIYSVYNMVVTGIKHLVDSLTTGMKAMLGNMLAKNEIEELKTTFHNLEWLLHTATVFVFGCTAVLIVPFVSVYTSGITDADYYQPLFAVLITLAHASHCLRLPYNILILAAGHYKQTQHCYIIAAVVNIVVSVLCVAQFGLVGVAIGTLAAMVYQTIWMAWYDSRHIIGWPIRNFIKQIVVDAVTFGLAFLLSNCFALGGLTYFSWVILAVKVALVWLAVVLAVNAVFYRKNISQIISKVLRRKKK